MRQYFPLDFALDDDLFYSYRISMGIFDSIISKDLEEKIKSAFQNKKASKSNEFDFYRQEFLKKFNLNENDVNFEVFTETSNFLSSIGKLNNEFISLLFQFNEIIKSNNASTKFIFAGNEPILYNSVTEKIFECKVLPLDPAIIGFVDYIDTRNETMKNLISKFNKKVSDLSPFLDNKHKNNKNDHTTYMKLLLRVSFIKSIALLKMYGKKIPIYLFDGSQLLIKIEPTFDLSNDGCMISYNFVNNQTDSPIVKTDLNYNQYKWFHSWKNTFRIPNDYFLFQNDMSSQYLANKLFAKNIENSEFSFTPQRKTISFSINENPKSSPKNENPCKKTSSSNKTHETQKEVYSEEENDSLSKSNEECNPNSPSLSKTTNDVINELLNKPNSNVILSKQKKKRHKQVESSDVESSQDYVDKLIQQQTMQLFNI